MKRKFKVSEVLRILFSDGWTIKAVRGDHRQLIHPTKSGKVTVAGKLSKPIPPNTLSSIETQSGLTIKENS
jgi:predicted RNA binding protein YcfA (HicA-like mRNA interferase family)